MFHCDADDEKKLGLLRDAGLHIIDISGIACEDWDILKLAVAVKVICCPKEELTDFHEVNNTSLLSLHFMEACISGAKSCSSQVLAEDVVSQLKGDARKYKGVTFDLSHIGWMPTARLCLTIM